MKSIVNVVMRVVGLVPDYLLFNLCSYELKAGIKDSFEGLNSFEKSGVT